MAKQFEVMAVLAKEAEAFSKKDAYVAMAGLVDKVADVKLQGPAQEALSNMAEAVGPQFVFSQLHKKAASHKNPKVHTPCTCQPAGLPDMQGHAWVSTALRHGGECIEHLPLARVC
jgi:hypothetical protein